MNMSFEYSDPSREKDLYTLPDIEVFKVPEDYSPEVGTEKGELLENGWYYWFCSPGYLPDSDPIGPYETEEAALQAARREE